MTNGCFNGEQDDSSKELCVSHVHANSFNEASNLLKAWQQALTTKIMEPMIKPNAELIKEKTHKHWSDKHNNQWKSKPITATFKHPRGMFWGHRKKLRYNGKANEPFRILLEWVVSICNYSNYIYYIYILAVYHDYIISCSMEIYDGGIPGSPTIHQKIGGTYHFRKDHRPRWSR